mgnify:CR=1 FL=1
MGDYICSFLERKSGVLMHVSSLWGEYSSGSFGKEAYEFVDFLKQSGFSYWQVLPFVIPDECNSPYKSYSTFGGNPYCEGFNLGSPHGSNSREKATERETTRAIKK